MLLLFAPAVLADEIRVGDLPPFKPVTIERFRAGQVWFVIPGPPERPLEKPITDVVYLQIDGADRLNRAESLIVRGKDSQAIRVYELALEETGPAWRQSLIRARLLQAADRQGRFDLATTTYIRLLDEIGLYAAPLQPTNLPRRGSGFRVTARRAIERALSGTADPDTRAALATLQREIDAVTNPSPTTNETISPATPTSRPTAAVDPREAETFALIASDLAAGRHGAARGRLSSLERVVSPAGRPTFLRLEAQLAVATAEKPKHWLKAGLTAMRVVVGYPDSPEAPACLYVSAVVHERIGRRALAVSLLRECKAHGLATPDVIEQTDAALARLGAER
jgi:hypothetical protein